MKSRRALWVELHSVLADALEGRLSPREDRDLAARLFAGSGADALRTSMAKDTAMIYEVVQCNQCGATYDELGERLSSEQRGSRRAPRGRCDRRRFGPAQDELV